MILDAMTSASGSARIRLTIGSRERSPLGCRSQGNRSPIIGRRRLGTDRLYAQAVVRRLNALPEDRRGRVVEIGCGLGDIIRPLPFRERLGLDSDPAVVRAGRLLTSGQRLAGLSIPEFVCPRDRLPGTFDVIVMVNWPSELDAETARTAIGAYVG
jgi:SAM-dependent methyltransferase